MMASEQQKKSLIFQAQEQVAQLLNTCPGLSSAGVEFVPEDALDIEYRMKDALNRQGLACCVMTPSLQYQGRCGNSTAWDFNNLTLSLVENPQVNRALSSSVTALDAAYFAQEWLCGPDSPTRNMFCPVQISQGEDGKLIAVTVELKALMHDERPEPPEPTNSKFTVNGASQEYDISSLTQMWLKEQGWLSPSHFWLVNFSSFETGTNLKTIGPNCFVGCTSLKQATIGGEVESLGQTCFVGCTGLERLFFKGRTLEQVQAMSKYPWGIQDTSVIHAEFE